MNFINRNLNNKNYYTNLTYIWDLLKTLTHSYYKYRIRYSFIDVSR